MRSSLRIIIGIGIFGLLAQAGWATLNFSTLPVWIHYHLHQSQYLGFVVAAFMVTEAIFRPAFGIISDNVGRKPVLLAAPTIALASTVLMLMAPQIGWLVVLSAVNGIGLSAFWPAAFATVADSTTDEYRSTAISVLNGSLLAGVAVGWFLGGLTNDLTHTLSGSFYFVAGMFIVAGIVGWFILPNSEHPRPAEQPSLSNMLRKTVSWSELTAPFRVVPDMIVLNLVIFAAIGLLMPIMKIYTMQTYHVTETVYGILVGPCAVMLGIAAVFAGKAADKWGHMRAVTLGTFISALSMWFVAPFHRLWVAAVAAIFIGIGFVLAYPAWMAIASNAQTSEHRGRVLGAVGMAEGVGAIFGVILGPLLFSSKWASIPSLGVTQYDTPFYLSAILLSLAFVIVFAWVRPIRNASH